MKNRLKEMIAAGERVFGTFYELGSPTAVQCIGIAGMDFIIIDTEHGYADVESALAAVTATAKYPTVPLVRVKDGSRASLLKMLDIGAMGLVVPCIETVEEVRQLVRHAKYAPLGSRGFAPTLAGQYGFVDYAQDVDAYFELCNKETLLLPQCETRGCLEHIDEIAGMEGVDGIFVGPYDLSVALGKPAQVSHPIVADAIAHILEVCKKHGKLTFIYAGNTAKSEEYFSMGFDAVACDMDSIVLVKAYQDMIKEIKG